MNVLKYTALGCVLLAGLAAVPATGAEASKWTYTPWKKSASAGYYYRACSYKTTSCHTSTKSYYCIYYPKSPRYIYYYEPAKKTYFARYPAKPTSKAQFEVVAPAKQKSKLSAIPDTAFKPAGPKPTVPGADDSVPLAPPPNDLPEAEDPPAGPDAPPPAPDRSEKEPEKPAAPERGEEKEGAPGLPISPPERP